MPPKKRYDDEEKQFQKAFGVEKMREDFNLRAAIYLKDNIHEHINDKTKADKALEKINKLIQSSAGEAHIHVSYSKSKHSDGDGRWFSKNMGSMQNMKREVRHTICKGIWIDLDIVNCHPTLLSQLCKNISKGVVCDLLAHCFGDFVQGITSENLLIKTGGDAVDAAKAQSWMSSLELKRLAMSNEITLQGDRSRVDGNIIKRISSGGDVIEMRTNYKDETRKRLQASFMLNCNDFPPIDPVDACATLEVFEYYSVFQPEHVIIERGDQCPKHWKVSDPSIKTVFVHREDVIDAFTMMVLGAWKPELLKAPARVVENTKLFKGNAAVSEYDRFAQIVKYNPSNTKDACYLTDEIRLIANKAGLKGMSSQVVNRYVKKLHGHEQFPPVYSEFRKDGKRGWGWSHLRVNPVVEYNFMEERRVENVARNARVNQQVRNGESELGKRPLDVDD